MGRKEQREAKRKLGNPAKELLKIMQKYMPDLWKQIDEMKDPRHQSYITYPQRVLIAVVLLKNLTGLRSMNEMTDVFNEDAYIQNIGLMCGIRTLEEIPHLVTVNNYLSRLEPENLEKIRSGIIYDLIRCRAFEKARYRRKWLVIVDGTRLCSFKKENDEHCLHVTHRVRETGEESTTWYHTVLEAKIVLGDGLIVSIASEFIENNAEDARRQKEMNAEEIKQDCESKAFKRLAEKLKKAFPRLPICILADGLYTTEPVFSICEKNGWEYIIRLKDGAMPAVAGEFHTLKDRDPENSIQGMKWVNGIETENRKLNVLELEEKKKGKGNGEENEIITMFQWVTSYEITRWNASGTAKTGRKRWKIENEGFNNQKNHRFEITHVNSCDYTAMKNHYLLIQISDLIRQLFELRHYKEHEIKEKIKNISSSLLRYFGRVLAGEDISQTGTCIVPRQEPL